MSLRVDNVLPATIPRIGQLNAKSLVVAVALVALGAMISHGVLCLYNRAQARELLSEARLDIYINHRQRAIERCFKALSYDFLDERLRMKLYRQRVCAYSQEKLYVKAIQDCDIILAMNLTDRSRGKCLFLRAQAYRGCGRNNEAIGDLTEAMALTWDYWPYSFLVNRGDTYLKLGQHQLAVNDLTQALALFEDAWPYDILWARALAYRGLGKHQLAINDLVQALSYLPREGGKRARLLGFKGDLYRDLNRHEEAFQNYKAALKILPSGSTIKNIFGIPLENTLRISLDAARDEALQMRQHATPPSA